MPSDQPKPPKPRPSLPEKLAQAQQEQERWAALSKNSGLSPTAVAWVTEQARSSAAVVKLYRKALWHESSQVENSGDQHQDQIPGLGSSPDDVKPTKSATPRPQRSECPLDVSAPNFKANWIRGQTLAALSLAQMESAKEAGPTTPPRQNNFGQADIQGPASDGGQKPSGEKDIRAPPISPPPELSSERQRSRRLGILFLATVAVVTVARHVAQNRPDAWTLGQFASSCLMNAIGMVLVWGFSGAAIMRFQKYYLDCDGDRFERGFSRDSMFYVLIVVLVLSVFFLMGSSLGGYDLDY